MAALIAKIALAVSIIGFAGFALIGDTVKGPRIGAVARDGWQSRATGRGAGSHHGGVDHWIYEEHESPNKFLKMPMLAVGGAGAACAAMAGVVAYRKRRKKDVQESIGDGDAQ